MKRVLALGSLCALAACSGATESPATAGTTPTWAAGQADRPNVVLFVVDDLGWSDTGAYGSTYHRTPHIDRLAREGVRFTQFYTAAPVCSPTRASIMTGKHPARLHLTDYSGSSSPMTRGTLPLSETTLGESFRDAGYATGYYGKWHLGTGAYGPEAQGFPETVAVEHDGMPSHLAPYWPRPWWRVLPRADQLADAPHGEPLTDRLTEEAVRFMSRHAEEPFFLVLSHYAVHLPLRADPELVASYEPREERTVPGRNGERFRVAQGDPVYAAMVQSVDGSVGRIVAALDSLGIAERTVFVFISDNGGLNSLVRQETIPTSNAPLRAGKGWLYEGGIRVPMMVRLPGEERRGALVDAPVISTDLYPTLLELAGIAPESVLDGRSFAPLLRGEAFAPDTLFWHYPHRHGSGSRPASAVRAGDYKLIEWLEEGRVELYDVRTDIGEERDLASGMPELAGELRQTLHRWRTRVRARLPDPAPGASAGEPPARTPG